MAITEIIRFGSKASPNSHSEQRVDNATIQEAIEALRESKRARHEMLGTEVQDQTAVQMTAEWDDFHQTHAGTSPIVDNVRSYLGDPSNIFHVELSQPILGPDGAGTSNVVEFAANYFPTASFSPDLQKKIEEDFLRFDEICVKGLKGNSDSSHGWVQEEQTRDGEKMKCFIIVRGWESMDHFVQSTKSEAFSEAIPILYAWNAPYEIVSVDFVLTETIVLKLTICSGMSIESLDITSVTFRLRRSLGSTT